MKTRPTLLYPQDFLSTQADCLKAKKLLKEAENEQHNKMLMEKTKLILTLTTQIFLGYFLSFLHQLVSTKYQCGPNQSSVQHNHKDSQQWKRGKVT
jgi:hypothetical protein